jgi:CRISPR-associated protein Cmr4
MLIQPYLVHALSPLHAGTGQSVDVVDLPIARMRATNIPFFPGASLKGVLRERRRALAGGDEGEDERAVFGPDHKGASEHAGAFAVTDARLLALPVRSFRGAFAWVTSSLLLTLARRDLVAAAASVAGATEVELPEVKPPPTSKAWVTSQSCVAHAEGGERTVYLEDLDLPAQPSKHVDDWARWLAPLVDAGGSMLAGRMVVVDDDVMGFLLETATQIDARVRIDEDTGTVAQGALWYEESLPAETLLLGLAMADRSRRTQVNKTAEQVLRHALPGEVVVQLGGKASVGRGRCRVVVIDQGGRPS